MDNTLTCPVCRSDCALYDVVDFNKSCEEARGQYLPLSGTPVYYAACPACDFCYAPELYQWNLERFESEIYNQGYAAVDPDYLEIRPRNNAETLVATFGAAAHTIRHLDYGGGNGHLAQSLQQRGWNSQSYDPLVDRTVDIQQLGRFELITAFEVFEHVPDVPALMASLKLLLAPDGIVLFSTLISDGNLQRGQRLTWWYASPRNGHISLYSAKSLQILAATYGFRFASFSAGLHLFCGEIPDWAHHLIEAA